MAWDSHAVGRIVDNVPCGAAAAATAAVSALPSWKSGWHIDMNDSFEYQTVVWWWLVNEWAMRLIATCEHVCLSHCWSETVIAVICMDEWEQLWECVAVTDGIFSVWSKIRNIIFLFAVAPSVARLYDFSSNLNRVTLWHSAISYIFEMVSRMLTISFNCFSHLKRNNWNDDLFIRSQCGMNSSHGETLLVQGRIIEV